MPKTPKSNASMARWPIELERAETHTQARIEFLAAIERNHPQILGALRRTAMPHFLQLLAKVKISAAKFNDRADIELQNRIWEALSSTVLKWARRFHLIAGVIPIHPPTLQPAQHWALWNRGRSFSDWLVQVCTDSLGIWAASKRRRTIAWCFEPIQQRLGLPGYAPTFLFVAAPWLPDRETLRAFHQRVGDEFQQALVEYTGPIASKLTEASTLPPPKGSRSEEPILTAILQARHAAKDSAIIPPMATKVNAGFTRSHFDWLVRYQVIGCSWSEIVNRSLREISPRAVMSGVKNAAALVIGEKWSEWLRKGKPGRPKIR